MLDSKQISTSSDRTPGVVNTNQPEQEAPLIYSLNRALMSLNRDGEKDEILKEALQAIGEGLKCARILICQCLNPQGGKIEGGDCIHYRWTKEGNEWFTQFKNRPYFDLPDEWKDEIISGSCIQGKNRELKPIQEKFLQDGTFGIFPLKIEDLFWGIIAVLRTEENPPFSDLDINLFQTFSSSIGNFLARKEAEKELKRQRNYYQQMLDLNPNLIYSLRPDGRIKIANKAFADLFESTKSAILGKTMPEITTNKEICELCERGTSTLLNKKADSFEEVFRHYKSEGEYTDYLVLRRPKYDEEGEIEEVLGIATDITELRRKDEVLKEELDLNYGIVSTTIDYIVLVDMEHLRLRFLDQKSEFMGFPRQEYEGNKTIEFFASRIHPDDYQLATEERIKRISESEEGQIIEMEYQFKAADDEYRWLYLRSRALEWNEAGELVKYISTIHDITDFKKLQQLNQEKELRYQNFVQNSLDGIYYMNCGIPISLDWPLEKQIDSYYQHAYIEECNIVLAKMYGANDPSEVIGKKLIDFHEGENYEQNSDSFRTFIESDYRVKGAETIEKLPSGEERYFINHAFGVIINNRLHGLWGTQQDITSVKRAAIALQESKQQLQLAVEGAQIGTWDWNVRTGDYFFNERYANMLGYEQDELGKGIQDFFAIINPDDLIKLNERVNQHVRGEIDYFELEIRLKAKNGDWKWVYDRGRIVDWDENKVPIRASGIHLDITALKRAEETLQTKLKELDLKNKELQQYIDSNMQLENFAYIASHDLKEPLRNIGNFAQLLDRRYSEQLQGPASDYLQFIVNGAKNMNQLIEDLLAYSRVNTEEHIIEEIALGRLLTHVQFDLRKAIEEKNATIKLMNLPDTIAANRSKVKRLFQNLLANAIKFNRENTPPEIKIEAIDKQEYWEFAVTDNGIGIHPDFQDKIFLLFKKLHSKKVFQGTGLGLAICKKIVEQHEGRIWVDSKEGEGACFRFTLSKLPLTPISDIPMEDLTL